MTKANDTSALARRVVGMLGRYMKAQDDLFKPSMGKILRIPGLYKPVDYGENLSSLKELKEELLAIKADIRRQRPGEQPTSLEDRFLGVLRRYVSQMGDAVERLASICRRLKVRSEGGAYDRREYKTDMTELRDLQRKHLDTGVILNELVKELERQESSGNEERD